MWIEIVATELSGTSVESRLARALWIEIIVADRIKLEGLGRGSREPCGLKSKVGKVKIKRHRSRLARALWIEISSYSSSSRCIFVEARESLVD